ncbi:MAG: undecaprenyldiphospho-muramoylpentapeptide beta-N-acetylglucosaminyltransferase [Saccharospirillaceae bacterium]|nr:undecaprenyldiphospho-muramoylpentapeptide beta-N-acetylglucosaminyltransferase [Saccharospirillaceae bacterium]MCD8530047.1 undecaprenyldiphospho-muramoylpentapeptide beta-N-acetylglucosaminyltransferase [Saccharospirillaceae bacterium]
MNQASSRNVLLMAGGTGGHVFPALAVAEQLHQEGFTIHWLGTASGIEKDLVPAKGYPLHCINISGLRGKGKLGLLTAPLRIIKAIWQARNIMKQVKPVAALGFGGYATGPGGVAARLSGVPLLIHEQNARAGMTNRLLSRISQHAMQAFPGALSGAQVTGNPVRESVLNLPQPAERMKTDEPLSVLIIGGSLGAAALNRTVLAAMQLLPQSLRPQLRHQVGKRNLTDMQAAYEQAGVQAEVVAFIDDMAAAYGQADLLICRAGALTVSEVAAAGCAAIFVPFPFAVDDHQTANAEYLANAGAGVICQQHELTAEWLASQWQHYSQHKTLLLEMASKARCQAITNATALVVEQIKRFARD